MRCLGHVAILRPARSKRKRAGRIALPCFSLKKNYCLTGFGLLGCFMVRLVFRLLAAFLSAFAFLSAAFLSAFAVVRSSLVAWQP